MHLTVYQAEELKNFYAAHDGYPYFQAWWSFAYRVGLNGTDFLKWVEVQYKNNRTEEAIEKLLSEAQAQSQAQAQPLNLAQNLNLAQKQKQALFDMIKKVHDQSKMEYHTSPRTKHLFRSLPELMDRFDKAQNQVDLDYKAQIENLKAQSELHLGPKAPANLEVQIEVLKAQNEILSLANLEYQAKIESLEDQIEAQKESETAQTNSDYKAQIEGLKAQNEALKRANAAQIEAQNEQHRLGREELKRDIKELEETWRVSGTLMNTLMQESIQMRKSQRSTITLEYELTKMKLAEREQLESIQSLQKELDSTKVLNLNYKSQIEELSKRNQMLVQEYAEKGKCAVVRYREKKRAEAQNREAVIRVVGKFL